jgi:hypothetical protein
MRIHPVRIAIVLLLAGLLAGGVAQAAAPGTMVYQGRLLASTGFPITATTSVTFRIYAAASGGTALWTQTISITPDVNGVFTVLLGSPSPALTASVFDGTTRYLGIQVASEAEMTPRQALSSSPYAFRTAMDPIAYGVVNTNGTIANAGSGNWTCSWNSANNWYQIAITGVSFSFYDQLALIQPAGGSGATSARFFTIDSNGSLLVRPWLHDGSVSQFVFQFVVYELPGMKRAEAAPPMPEGVTEAELLR